MSNRITNNKQSKFCKFCKDSGKNEAIYISHNVKDKNGIVCCPILMTTLCNNCGNFGHTLKFCKSVKKQNTIQKPVQIRVEVKKQNAPVNPFAALDNDDDVSESETNVVIEPKKPAAESIFVKYKKRVENWADECSDTDED